MNRSAAAIVLSAAVLAPASRADILYQAQERFIRPYSTQVNAPGFDPWEADLYIPGGFNDAAHAKQNSRLGPGGITLSQFAWAQDGLSGSFGIATSSLDVTFSLASPEAVQISGSWYIDGRVGSSSGGNSYTATFVLTRDSQTIYSQSRQSDPFESFPAYTVPLEFSGVLSPGTYRIVASSYARSGAPSVGPPCTVELSATITIPAPASAAILLGVPLWTPRRRRCR